MNNGVSSLIRRMRIANGLSEEAVAGYLGISPMAYWDLEHYEDEWVTAISLGQVRKLCLAVSIDLTRLLAAYAASRGLRRGNSGPASHASISERRQELGMSTSQLADQTSFSEEALHAIEEDGAKIDEYPVFLAAEIARVLDVSLEELLVTP